MRPAAITVLCGALFGLGLVVSGMTDPAVVLGFLDVTGAWNPALALVMGGAIAIHAPLVWILRRRNRTPIFAAQFHWPQLKRIDPTLVIGAALFGVGWGLAGLCPGPALVSLGSGATSVIVFVVAMIATMAATRAVTGRPRRPR